MRFLLLLAAAAPMAAPAVEWTANVGVDYTRTDAWTDGKDGSVYPRLDLDLGLQARGFLLAPGVIDWSASARGERISTSRAAGDSTLEGLNFRGAVAAFRAPKDPVSLDLFVDRRIQDFSTDADTSRLTELSFGGNVDVRATDRPTLSAGYTRTAVESSGALLGDSEKTIQSVRASTTLGRTSHSATANYAGTFSDGTWASDNFMLHRVNLDATARIDPRTTFHLSDTYTLHVPTAAGATNPRQEMTTLLAMLSAQGEGSAQHTFTYRYLHALQTDGAAADGERANQKLEYARQFSLSEASRIRARADVSLAQDRSGGSEVRSTGERVGVEGFWRSRDPDRRLELRGGPSLGLIQTDDGANEVGYGLVAGVAWSRRFTPLHVAANYTATYATNMNAVSGWFLTQSGSASVERAILAGVVTGEVAARSTAGDSPLFGPAASRQIEIGGRIRQGNLGGTARFILSSNVRGALNDSLASDGLFIPAGYDSHSRSVVLGANAQATRHLGFNAELRHTSTVLPDRPDRSETELRGALEWSYGALRIAIEDRYLRVDEEGDVASRNLLMLKLYRVFGSRF